MSIRKRRLGWCRKLLLSLAAAALMVAVVCMIFEEAFIFFPSPYPEGDWEAAGLAHDDVEFESADGVALHGWYLSHPRPKAHVLYCHGNAGNLTHRAGVLATLRDTVGVSVLIFDYRGYGRSQGKPTEQGILHDARAARAWLARREGIEESEIVLLGRSLGGGVAVDLAARDGARALVLESTFTSVPDMASHCFPILPLRYLLTTRLDAAAKIGDYHGPLLISHGDADSIVPYRMGRQLFDAANQPKRFITLAGGDHNDPQGMAYYETLAAWLDELPSP